jgi:transcription antitermination factor NusG
MMALQQLVDPQPIPAPLPEAPWFVMLTQPQQDLTTVWRLHELGLELFVPVVRRRVKTGRTGRNGHKVTRVIAKPMFPGYGFLRDTGSGLSAVLATRGVRDFMRNERGGPVTLPHQAVQAVFAMQTKQHWEWLEAIGSRRGALWKKGDVVRVDADGGAYAGLVATVDKLVGKDRVAVLFGMIRHTIPGEMLVAV